LDPLWERFHRRLTDPRHARGVRHQLAGMLVLVALALVAGCKGVPAIAEFAESLNHGQRRRRRCRPRRGRPREYEKPKADKALMLVNFQTPEQRLVDQVAVPRDTNEEAAVAAYLPRMDLAGVCLTTDAAHTTKAHGRQLTQGNGAEFLLFLNANQPLALAKAEQRLPGALPPSGEHAGQGPRPH
jgi:hypothetical protein